MLFVDFTNPDPAFTNSDLCGSARTSDAGSCSL